MAERTAATNLIVGDDCARFWSKVGSARPHECWPWLGSLNREGYGKFWLSGQMIAAHRAAYLLFVGPIPAGLTIDHVWAYGCVRKDCVNFLNHFQVVTRKVNTLRSNNLCAQNARKTHCPRGHEFTPENTYINSRGSRECRICGRAKGREKYHRAKARTASA